MNGSKKTPGEFVTSVTVKEILISTGLQLAFWANDIAFTDAPFGETWSMETANRMACLSELLKLCHDRMSKYTLGVVVDLPPTMIGQIQVNPYFEPGAEEPVSKDTGSTDEEGGMENSIDDFPF